MKTYLQVILRHSQGTSRWKSAEQIHLAGMMRIGTDRCTKLGHDFLGICTHERCKNSNGDEVDPNSNSKGKASFRAFLLWTERRSCFRVFSHTCFHFQRHHIFRLCFKNISFSAEDGVHTSKDWMKSSAERGEKVLCWQKSQMSRDSSSLKGQIYKQQKVKSTCTKKKASENCLKSFAATTDVEKLQFFTRFHFIEWY